MLERSTSKAGLCRSLHAGEWCDFVMWGWGGGYTRCRQLDPSPPADLAFVSPGCIRRGTSHGNKVFQARCFSKAGRLDGALAVAVNIDEPGLPAVSGDEDVVHVVEVKGLKQSSETCLGESVVKEPARPSGSDL